MADYLALSPADTATIDHWIASMQASGRVVTRLPYAVGLAQAGQLGSRLETQDSSGSWDYEPAPLAIRVLDNWAATSDELTTYLEQFSLGNAVDLAAQGVGTVAHTVVTGIAEATAVALGIPVWMLWGAVGLGVYYAVTHVGETKRVVRQVLV